MEWESGNGFLYFRRIILDGCVFSLASELFWSAYDEEKEWALLIIMVLYNVQTESYVSWFLI